MIKLIAISPSGASRLELAFSDGSTASWSAEEILARETVLTQPLKEPDYFRRAFIEAGALAWPNGLELSPSALHRDLASRGALKQRAA
jgi:hypothetical protein